MTNQQGAPEALRLADALASNYFDGKQGRDVWDAAAAELRRLHAENERLAALVEAQQPAPSAAAAPSVSDRERALHEIILNRLSHAELLEKAHYLMELNSNQARTIGELQDLVSAAPQPSHTPQADSQPAPDGWDADDSSKPRSRADLSRVLTEWNETTGALPRDSGWFCEVLGMMEDAYDLATEQFHYDELAAEVRRIAHKPGSVAVSGTLLRAAAALAARVPADSVTAPAGGVVAARQGAGPFGRPCKVGGPCVAGATSACACSELVDTDSNDTAAAPTPPAQAADSVLEDAAHQAMLAPQVSVSENTLLWWRELATANPQDLVPRIDSYLDAARKQGANHD